MAWRFAEARSWAYKNSGTLKLSVSREYKVNVTDCTGEYSMGMEPGGGPLTTVVGDGGRTSGIFMSGGGGWVPGVGGGSFIGP